jgi:regulator of sigma E protease
VNDILFHGAAFLVAIGVLIVVHEFGHFWVARRLGVKVLRFSVGFGKPLWIWQVGPDRMELVVSALPLGGYVKMLDETEGEVAENEKGRSFNRQPVWKRMAIVAAGPAFNLAFAILAYWVVFMSGVDGIKPIVGHVAPDSVAQQAGFRTGDEILTVDGHAVQSWDQRRLYLFQRALDQAQVAVEVRDRNGNVRLRTLDFSSLPVSEVNAGLVERGIGLMPNFPEPLPTVGALEDGPAARAGMQVGDRVLSVDGSPVARWNELADIINKNAGRALRLTIERSGARQEIEITPEAAEHNGKIVGLIRIRPQPAPLPDEMRVHVRFGPVESLSEAARSTWSMSWLTLEMFYRMLKLEVSTKNISGPITIAQYAGYSARVGLDQFVVFLAVISISLGVLNLLPIPILDGGHLLYHAIEAVKGSPVSERSMAIGQQIGIVILVGLMSIAFYNDITRLFH